MAYSVVLPVNAPASSASAAIEVRLATTPFTVYGSATLDANAQGFVACTFPDAAVLNLVVVRVSDSAHLLSLAWDYRVDSDSEPSSDLTAILAAITQVQNHTDLITNATAITVTASALLVGRTIRALRGDKWTISITGLGVLTGRTKLYFTAKTNLSDADSASIIQVEESGGLLYLNGAAGTAGNASLTVDDATVGDVTLVVKAAATAAVAPAEWLAYDVQLTSATTVQTLTSGTLTVIGDTTRAVV